MAKFLNSLKENNDFTLLTEDEYFVDKTELISKLNEKVNKSKRYVCITRPRRFGKSINALMLASYYSKNLDTKNIFDNLDVAKSPSYEKHLNKHNVIFMSFNTRNLKLTSYEDYRDYFIDGLVEDLKEICPDLDANNPISTIFDYVYGKTKEGFIFIIDEWDYIFNDNIYENKKEYTDKDKINFLAFLTDLLKDKSYVEFAYMTGILPIAKYFSTSFCNMFPNEHGAFDDFIYDHYFGFTQPEVEKLCAKQNKISLEELKDWYNGYQTDDGTPLYNPRSVNYALSYGRCVSYWTNTGKMDEILDFIKNDIFDLKKDIFKMIEGESIYEDVPRFATEKMEFTTRGQILSAMVVFGFLSYRGNMLSIPNKELRIKFIDTLKNEAFGEFATVIKNSEALLKATIEKDTETMSNLLKEAHSSYSSLLTYNKENTLSCVIQLAYITALKKYDIRRELKGGEGYADFVFIPYDKRATSFILELKVDSTPEEALKQIKNKNYMQALRNCTGKKLAIGIAYNKDNTSEDDNRRHFVKIEEL